MDWGALPQTDPRGGHCFHMQVYIAFAFYYICITIKQHSLGCSLGGTGAASPTQRSRVLLLPLPFGNRDFRAFALSL